jgi:hypothetical protein
VRDIDVNLYDWERLSGTFGPFVEEPSPKSPGRVVKELVGAEYRRILSDTTRLIGHQWREHIQDSAVKGFLFYGGVGVGKTTMAKRIAYELGRLFGTDQGERPERGGDGAGGRLRHRARALRRQRGAACGAVRICARGGERRASLRHPARP